MCLQGLRHETVTVHLGVVVLIYVVRVLVWVQVIGILHFLHPEGKQGELRNHRPGHLDSISVAVE